MTTDDYNPTDPEFLVSREIDGDLSEDERRRLGEALAGSESLRAERDRLRTLDALVSKWAKRQANLDWETHGKLVGADLTGETDDGKLKKVDRLLDEWSRRTETVDSDAFATAVLARIAPQRKRPMLRRMIFRVGVPAAAAALLAVAVTVRFWFAASREPVTTVTIRQPAYVQTAMDDGAAPIVVVSFARTATGASGVAQESPGISYMTLGAEPLVRSWDYSAPL